MLPCALLAAFLGGALSPSLSAGSCGPALGGDDKPKGPYEGTFVLRGCSVWEPGAPPAGERALLLRNGIVEAIGGADLPAPPEARVLQAEPDWVVYPGWIHAAFDAGAPAPPAPFASAATDPRLDPVPAMEWGPRRGLHAWLRVADTLSWDPEKTARWREAGFTSAHVLPREGILRGRAAWISLNGHPLGDALLQRDGLQTVSLQSGAGGYPATPMAALAVLRQAFLDARRLEDLAAAGRGRHRDDPDLRALAEDAGRPLLFLAESTREIENALDLARDYAPQRPLVVLGGRDGYKIAGRLREQGAAVLFRLDLRDAPRSDEDLKVAPPEKRPWWQDPAPLREHERAEHARAVGAFRALREAGVRCALMPAGPPKDFRDDLAQLRKDGLADDAILLALTSDVAGILGLPGAGRVAEGCGADLVVSRGPWNLEKPDFAWVFADGRGWEFPPRKERKETEPGKEEAASGERAGRVEADPVVYGEWEFRMETPEGEQVFHVVIDADTGTVETFRAADPSERLRAEDLVISGNEVSFQIHLPEPDLPLRLKLELFEDEGEAAMETPFGTFAASGRRVGAAPAPPVPPKAPEQRGEPQEPAAAAGGPAEAGGFPVGHPEHPVETPRDRKPRHVLEGRVLLRGGTLYPLAGREPFAGDLLIEDGRIVAVGGTISTLREVPTLDATGWHVVPGIIDPHSHLALDSVNEGTVAISAECRIGDMLHPEEVGIFRAAAGGTAVAQALHGSANPIGGQAAVWELDVNRRTIAELLLPGAPQGIKFALGENVKRSNSHDDGARFPISRAGVEAVYERAFLRAQEYAAARRRAAAGNEPAFRRDVRLDALADILEGRIHVQCHGYRADELLMFLGVCQRFRLRPPTFQHVLEGYKVAPELAAAGAMASTFMDWWAYKIEAYDAIPWNCYLLQRAGVVASVNSDSDEMIRRLNTEAGKALRYGPMSYEDALALCTRNPARQLHLEDRLGTLEPGKDGTVTAFDGPPLSTYSRCVLTLARGRVLFERDAEHDARWEAYARAAGEFAAAHSQPPREARREPRAEEWERWTRRGRGLSYFVHNARVHPVAGPPFAGAVLVRDGRIEWTGERFEGELPAGCTVVDAGGMECYPGFIDGGDIIGLYEIGSVRGTVDHEETGDWQPDLSVASAIHPDSAHHAVHRMNGVTHVLIHGTRGLITGQAALIQLDGETPEEMAVAPDLALHVRFPSVARPEPGKEPEDPDGLKELERWFAEAASYGERMDRCRAAGVELPRREPKLEALLPYARGRKPVLLEADSHYTLMRAVRWAEERGLDWILCGAQDGWKVAGYLGARRARIVAGPVHSLPSSATDPFDSRYRNPAVLHAAGCEVALRTENPEVTRNLPFEAATAAAHGWTREQALHGLTLGAARVLGVDAFTGSIEPGKAANFFLAAGDPLDFPGSVRRMWIGGREVALSSRQTELRDRYEARVERSRSQPPGS